MDFNGSLILAEITAAEIANDFAVITNAVDGAIGLLFPLAAAVLFFGVCSYILMKFVYGR